MRIKNKCSKRVDKEQAYEVWKRGDWIWYVLKKYQTPIKEAQNKYARWHCLVVSPMVPNGEVGDVYISDIKGTGAEKIIDRTAEEAFAA
jgi:hypothetical protein|tara:strand:- start:1388 stop:1654 length:267 start_codon:yes stop_codon:yes gene_type:complete